MNVFVAQKTKKSDKLTLFNEKTKNISEFEMLVLIKALFILSQFFPIKKICKNDLNLQYLNHRFARFCMESQKPYVCLYCLLNLPS